MDLKEGTIGHKLKEEWTKLDNPNKLYLMEYLTDRYEVYKFNNRNNRCLKLGFGEWLRQPEDKL